MLFFVQQFCIVVLFRFLAACVSLFACVSSILSKSLDTKLEQRINSCKEYVVHKVLKRSTSPEVKPGYFNMKRVYYNGFIYRLFGNNMDFEYLSNGRVSLVPLFNREARAEMMFDEISLCTSKEKRIVSQPSHPNFLWIIALDELKERVHVNGYYKTYGSVYFCRIGFKLKFVQSYHDCNFLFTN